jgi:hypothetical protein
MEFDEITNSPELSQPNRVGLMCVFKSFAKPFPSCVTADTFESTMHTDSIEELLSFQRSAIWIVEHQRECVRHVPMKLAGHASVVMSVPEYLDVLFHLVLF